MTVHTEGTTLQPGKVECDMCEAQTRKKFYGRREARTVSHAEWQKNEDELWAFCPLCNFKRANPGCLQPDTYHLGAFAAHWVPKPEPHLLAIENLADEKDLDKASSSSCSHVLAIEDLAPEEDRETEDDLDKERTPHTDEEESNPWLELAA